MPSPLRRLMLSLAFLVLSTSYAYAAKATSWWCYNGSCCKWTDGAIVRDSCTECPGVSNGENGPVRPGQCY